ncbi:MAG: arylesterase [Oceanospirillaceae bacterium]|jgi:acyl-CoA thioesterase-1|nr:arylesterase [Oceanospirillaceae bacterium]
MRVFLFLILLISGVAQASPLLVLGDSLSAAYGIERDQGWVNLLRQRLSEQGYDLEVVNASVSGETTSGGLSRLPPLLETHQPSIVIIELGANDGLRGTPLDIVRRNLEQLVETAEVSGARVILVGNHLPPNYGPRYTQAFFALFQEVAEEKSAALVPFLLEGVADDWDLMQEDGYHPKASAQAQILETVWDELGPMLKQMPETAG